MKTNDLLNQLSQNISDSYDVVEAGGGAMPSDRITWNLANAIRTIPQPMPDVPLYGKVEYYPWSQARNISGDMVEIGDVDENKLDEFLATYPTNDEVYDFRYEPDWESEDPESNYVWWWSWQEGELKIQPEDFASTTGINATVEEGADWAVITIEKSYTVDTSAELLTTEFSSLQQFQDFSSYGTPSYYVRTVGDSEVLNQSVYSVVIGREITSIPDYFIVYDENLAEFDLSGAVVTSIGKGFLYNCQNFNSPLALDNVETIDSEFLYGCRVFNQELNIPACESIGDSFLCSCQAFNQPIDVTAFSEIPRQFLNYCYSFNQPINITGRTELPEYFLYHCQQFNQPLDTSSVTTVGTSALQNITAFNYPLDFSNVTKIGGTVLYGCTVFNQPLDLRKVTTIEYSFLYNCSSFNSPIQLQALQSVGPYFLNSCSSFNQPITIPATLNTMGNYFMYRCDSMTSTITCNCPATVVPSDNYELSTTSSSAPVFTTGVTLTGSYASAWKSRLPDRNTSPYRKLKVV